MLNVRYDIYRRGADGRFVIPAIEPWTHSYGEDFPLSCAVTIPPLDLPCARFHWPIGLVDDGWVRV